MNRYFSFALSILLMVGVAMIARSGAGQSGGGGAGGGGGGGASGSGGAGASGTSGTGGAAGTAGTAGAAGAGNVGTAGNAGAAGAGAAGQQNAAGAAGQARPQGFGGTTPGAGAGSNARANIGANRQGVGANNNFNFNSSVSQTPFFSDPGVQQQLRLNQNQFNTLNRAYLDAYGRYNRGVTGLSNNLTAQQRQAQLEAYTNQFYNDFGRSLDTTFTDPRMRTRYDQLNRQHMGFSAFNNPAFQRQLNLTPQQTAQIRQLAAVWRQQLQQLRGQDSTNVSINPQQWTTMYNQYWDQMNRVLTPEQKQSWAQMTGERYNFSPNVYDFERDSTNVEGYYADPTRPGNQRNQPTGPDRFLLGGQNEQTQTKTNPQNTNPRNTNPSRTNPQTPQGGTASGTQGGTVR
jgi:hypothetical protein